MPDEPDDFTKEQLDDLATLLEQTVISGNILALATSLLDEKGADEANDAFTKPGFAQRVVELLAQKKLIGKAIAQLLQPPFTHSRLINDLNRIVGKERLDDDDARQAFVNTYEPFLSSDAFRRKFPRIMRTVCAIGLGGDVNALTGSGFLVGPDLVMTNYHVLLNWVNVEGGQVVAKKDGDQIFCFFDYFSDPGPRFPPPDSGTFVCVPAVKEGWLVKASAPLPGEGGNDLTPSDATGKYDYAVIQLSRKIGNLPAQLSGGGARGWLTLPDTVDTTAGRRVIVYQHPGKSPQQFDIGDYKTLDGSLTRVRYTVSTAKGSSGGAAVDKDGELFALHVAEVTNPAPIADKMNQGVLINLIAEDLKIQPTAWKAQQPPPEDQPMSFWSLTDDMKNPQPIIGRDTFRDRIYEMIGKSPKRVMVIWGPRGSGVKYSVRLLQRIVGHQTPVVTFHYKDVKTKSAEEFLPSLLKAFGITGVELPSVNQTENFPRRHRELVRWLAQKLADDEKNKRVGYPAWVVFNYLVPEGENLQWEKDLDEFIATLAGKHDLNEEAIDVPQLRLLFLTSAPASLPLTNVERYEENLGDQTDYIADYIVCLERAYHAMDKDAQFGGTEFFETIGEEKLDARPNDPQRQVLSDFIRHLVIKTLKR